MDQESEFCSAVFYKSERPDDGLFSVCCQKWRLNVGVPLEYDADIKDMIVVQRVFY